jgi:endonuclease/exonuclease/phosphatase (EEP) superfamily protein YafD
METTDRPALRRALPSVAAAALPWTWFAVRDVASLMDLVATGLPVIVAGAAAVALVLLAVTRRPAWLVAAVSVVTMGAVAVAGPWLPAGGADPADPIRVAAVNAWAGNATPAAAAADVSAQDADVVVIVETPFAMPGILEPRFPHSAYSEQGGHTLFSRFPIRYLSGLPGGTDDDPVSRWELSTPAGPVILYSVHLRRPDPRGAVRLPLLQQRAVVDTLVRAVAAEVSPVILAGDFNFSDRTWGYRRLDGPLRDAGRASRTGPTYRATKYRPFLLRIDHVFVSPRWCAGGSGRFTIAGSDHRGVYADVGPCRG